MAAAGKSGSRPRSIIADRAMRCRRSRGGGDIHVLSEFYNLMQIGMIGLGRMGANMVRRLMRAGHTSVVYDRSAASVAALAGEGAVPSDTLAAFIGKLTPPRVLCLMVPAGAVDGSIAELL